jgi:hypothetical protein
MFIKSRFIHNLSLAIIIIFLSYLTYLFVPTFIFVKNHHVGLDDSKYIHKVSTEPYIISLANDLTKDCQSKLCEAQNILSFVTDIEYKVNNFITMSPKKTLRVGYGDCDDKSNLLISLLKARNIESYFVLVPKHIFVIVALEDKRLNRVKGLVINQKKYYILESTAKNSLVGFPLKYKLNEIEAVIEPFENKKVEINTLEYKR